MTEFENANSVKEKKKSFFQKAKKFGKQGRFGKGRSIESDTYHYLLRVLETLNNQPFESPEEKSVFIINVFEQTEEQEVDIALEDFRVTERFMEALTKDMRVMMVDPFGSHVLEKLLFLSAFNGQTEEESFHYRSLWVLKVSKFAINNFEFFAEDLYASHVLKTAFQCLSGSKYAMEQGAKVTSSKEYSFVEEGNDGYLDTLVSSLDKSLLYTLSKSSLNECKMLVKDLLDNVFDEDEVSFESPGVAQLLEMMISVTNEHLPKQFKKIYSRFLEGNTFIIQKLLNTCQDKERFEEWYTNELDDKIESQSHFSVALSKALKIYDSSKDQDKTVQALIFLGNKGDEGDGSSEKTVNKIGSQIIQELLRFNKPIKTVNSLLFMNALDLRGVLVDPKGCHITGSFISSKNIGEKSRDGLIKALMGHFRFLCCNKFGSRSFDEIWKGASSKGRDLIAAELSKEADLLKSNHYGQFIHSNLRLDTYKRNYQDWKSGISAKEKKRELFKDILGTSDKHDEKDLKRSLDENDVDSSETKKKKRSPKKVAKSYLDDL
ncbi:Pumilio domaincontaining protein C14orf21like [Caligus rogercresseyi]|uniref:Pumilio domaincontaining protein C14orf21like n=1 Tax=Caligus rogercresseyi TaxID=217165 RepID=A0A7T8KKC2_CALRO|nr:Pumilio domaincontaining protein C14orf21like [Caligus rogercresseyi]